MSPRHAASNVSAARGRRLAHTLLAGPVAAGVLTIALTATDTPVSTAWTWTIAALIITPVWNLNIRHALRSSTDATARFGIELCAGSTLVSLAAWALSLTVALALAPLGEAALNPDYARHLADLIAICGVYLTVTRHFRKR